MDIKINLVEVASELAHERTLNELVAQELIECGDDMWINADSDILEYKEFVQDEFNNWYDYYYNTINSFKENKNDKRT